MFSIILMVLLLAGGITALILGGKWRKSTDPDTSAFGFGTKIFGWILLAALLVVAFFSFTFQVGAKEYGVLTTYGKPSAHDYGSGLHFKAPWQKAVSVDGKRKTYAFGGDNTEGFDRTYKCIATVIGNGTPSCVVATLRWQIEKDQASVTYSNYGTGDPTEHFGEAVIRAQAAQVIPIVVRTYNPISQLTVLKGKATGESVENASFAPDYGALSDQAKALLQSRVDGEATIQSFAISAVPLDGATEQKLSQFIQEQAKTRTALQAIETNTNQALANQKLEQSLERSPGLLVSKCLDEVADGIAKGYQFNAGFSCFGSGSVVIPSGK